MRSPPLVVASLLIAVMPLVAPASEPTVRTAAAERTFLLTPGPRPAEFRYAAFPSLARTGPDEVWIAFKAGRSHATDAGSAIEVVRHTLSNGATKLIQRLPAPPPKLYQMGELTRLPDGAIAVFIDVQAVGWDGRHYRSGAEVFRWNSDRVAFDAPQPLGVVDGVLYGYPFDFIPDGAATVWQLIMAFGYHLPGGRWSVDALRSDDAGRSWHFVRNLTEEFGGIHGNESAFVRHGDGFIVTTRGYDNIERLHQTDGAFHVRRQVELTGKYPFLNRYVGRPRLFVRDGQGYLIGRNWTRPTTPSQRNAAANPMQLCLFRFDPETLAISSCVILDNANNENVTDGYYAVTAFSATGAETRLHVFTYKAVGGKPPEIVRFDYRWDDVK